MPSSFLLWKEVKATSFNTERDNTKQHNHRNQLNMKRTSLLVAAIFTAALGSAVVGQERTSSQNSIAVKNSQHFQFDGTLTAAENFRLLGDPPFLFFVDGAGTAISTQLGQFTYVYSALVAFSDVIPLTTPGRARFIAANGDNLFTSSTALNMPTSDPNISNIVETHTVTGGTGQFEGAKGEFTITRVITVKDQEALDGTTTGSFHGTVTLKKHKH
jgi:hypothetical protein